jgi:hypothetical protein
MTEVCVVSHGDSTRVEEVSCQAVSVSRRSSKNPLGRRVAVGVAQVVDLARAVDGSFKQSLLGAFALSIHVELKCSAVLAQVSS